MELISIIIPVYNTQKFLKECMDSVVRQTYKNIEIICVNDGSQDESSVILQEYSKKDKRIVVVNQDNKGLSAARNTGLDIAKGDWIMFVDSDDWIEKDTCEKVIQKAKEFNADIVFWSYMREFVDYAKGKEPVEKREVYYYTNDEFTKLHRRIFGLVDEELANPSKADSLVTAWGKLYRREIVQDLKFVDTKIIGTEDALFNVYAFGKSKTAVFLPEYLYHYRKYNVNSLTKNYNPMLFERWQNLYTELGTYIQNHELQDDFRVALSNRRALGIIGLCLNISESGDGIINNIRKIKNIISSDLYHNAFIELEYKYFPIHWKIFFSLAKNENAIGVYSLIIIMQLLRA